MFKRAALILIALLLLLSISACGGDKDEAPAVGDDAVQTDNKSDSKKDKDAVTEQRAAEDLQNSPAFSGYAFAGEIVELVIDERFGDSETGTESLHVTVTSENEWYRRTCGYIMDYQLVEKSWSFVDAYERYDDKEWYEPLIGVEREAADEEYDNDNAVMIAHAENLEAGTCSYTYEEVSEHLYCVMTTVETLHYVYDNSVGCWNVKEITTDKQTAEWDIVGYWTYDGRGGNMTSGWSEDICVQITEVGADFVHLIADHDGEGGVIFDGTVPFDPLVGLDCWITNPHDDWESFGVVIMPDGAEFTGTGMRVDENIVRSTEIVEVVLEAAPETDFTYTLDDETQTVVIRAYKGSASQLRVPDTIEGYAVVAIGEGAFAANQTVTKLVLPETVTYIGDDAFSCMALEDFELPAGVTHIGARAFEYCRELTTLDLPEGLTYLGERCFAETGLDEVVIPDSITEIPYGAFDGCGSLIKLHIGAGVERIGDYAFEYCWNIESLVIPGSVKSIGENAFAGCHALMQLTIEDGVQEIGAGAFESDYYLEEIVLPDSVTSIGTEAFRGCISARSLRLSASLDRITWAAFLGCESLESIVVPEGVTEIEASAFNACSSVNIIELPHTLTFIDEYAFADNYYLTTVHFTGDSDRWGEVSIASSGNEALLEANMKYESSLQ